MKKIISIFLVFVILFSLCACGQAYKGAVHNVPFSAADWSWTQEQVKSAEGDPDEVYASIYGGDTYSYYREYLGRQGTLKYMFTDDGKLASIAWAYVDGDKSIIDDLYSQIRNDEISRNGKSSANTDGNSTNGNTWYLNDCDILVYTIYLGEGSGLQYSYINRDYSKRDIKNGDK